MRAILAYCSRAVDSTAATATLYLSQDMNSVLSLPLPAGLLKPLFWVAVVCCAVAQLYILRAVFRVIPAETASANVPLPRRRIEIAWAILPAGLLVLVFIGAWRTMKP